MRKTRVPLSLNRFVSVRDLRKLIWKTLDNGDVQFVRWADDKTRFATLVAADCARKDYFGLLKWLHAQGGCYLDTTCCTYAAGNGNIQALKWLREQGRTWGSENVCTRAAETGHLEVLKWLRE